ncbi:MAG: SMC-Scp complex subunit ScpB [Acidimicrobiia bacterium]|nr:SMC-Scp complex subunit ScpB [Acidimicrobiia bacterium]
MTDLPERDEGPTPASVEEAKRAIEAVVMVADEPVDPQLLGELTEISPARVEEICAELAAEYEAEGRGFVLVRVAGGYRFQSHPDQAPYIERFVLDGQSARLSAAALETLAIVAYKQPVSRAQVAAIRGVGVDGVMRTLQQRGYIEEIGRDPGPGQAVLFGTTGTFLERLGLDSLRDLPALGDFVPGADVVEALEAGLRIVPTLDLDATSTAAPDGPAATTDPEPIDPPDDPGDQSV